MIVHRSIIHNSPKNGNYPNLHEDEQINKMGYIHTTEYFSAMEKNEGLIYAITLKTLLTLKS